MVVISALMAVLSNTHLNLSPSYESHAITEQISEDTSVSVICLAITDLHVEDLLQFLKTQRVPGMSAPYPFRNERLSYPRF